MNNSNYSFCLDLKMMYDLWGEPRFPSYNNNFL
jgi:hypothetical protein